MAKAQASRRPKEAIRTPDPKKTNSRGQYFSRALEKGLQALQVLSQSPDGLTLTQVANTLGLTKASAFRIIRTLEVLGHLAKTPAGRYTVASGFLPQLPSRSIQAVLPHAAGLLYNLSLEFRETTSMAALFENHIEVVFVVESPQLIRMGNTVGRILPPHASSMGKAISAFQNRETCQRLLRSYGTSSFTDQTITDELALHREFEKIRERHYAEDWEESTPGGICFGAPILGPGQTAIGAVSLSMPRMRLGGDSLQRRIVDAVVKTATQISTCLDEIETGVSTF